MAIVYVQENFVNTSAGGSTPVTFSVTNAVAAGNHAIVIWASGSSTAATISTNASGATAQVDVNSGTSSMITIGSIYAPNGITVGNTITVGATSGGVRGILVEEFSGLSTTSWIDQFTTSAATALAMTVGPTAATSQSVEVAIGAWCVGNTAVTPFAKDAAYSLFTTGLGGFSAATKAAFAEYQILAATGAQTATATEAGVTARAWVGAIATYAGASAATPAQIDPVFGVFQAIGNDPPAVYSYRAVNRSNNF